MPPPLDCRPEKEGIETPPLRRRRAGARQLDCRPEKEGIETTISPVLSISTGLDCRPEKEGIETSLQKPLH